MEKIIEFIKKFFDSGENNEPKTGITIAEAKKLIEEAEAEKIITLDKELPLKMIIVSDNHGKEEQLEEVLTYYPDADCFLHCGDSNLEPDNELMKQFIAVRGNTDYTENYPDEQKIKLASGEMIFIEHGHKSAVEHGPDRLIYNTMREAKEAKHVIALYGHTHKVDVVTVENLLVINPGSIKSPRDGVIKTYAKLEITQNEYHVQILDISNHHVVKEFNFDRVVDNPVGNSSEKPL